MRSEHARIPAAEDPKNHTVKIDWRLFSSKGIFLPAPRTRGLPVRCPEGVFVIQIEVLRSEYARVAVLPAEDPSVSGAAWGLENRSCASRIVRMTWSRFRCEQPWMDGSSIVFSIIKRAAIAFEKPYGRSGRTRRRLGEM
jgi:hypothetical protein